MGENNPVLKKEGAMEESIVLQRNNYYNVIIFQNYCNGSTAFKHYFCLKVKMTEYPCRSNGIKKLSLGNHTQALTYGYTDSCHIKQTEKQYA